MEVARKLNAEEKTKLRDTRISSPFLLFCFFGVPFLH